MDKIHILVIIFTLYSVVLLCLAYFSSRNVKTLEDYTKNENPFKSSYSLTISNISLATGGFLFYIFGVKDFGIYWIFVPFASLLGLYLLLRLMRTIQASKLHTSIMSYVDDICSQVCLQKNNKKLDMIDRIGITKLVYVILVVSFILVAPLELFMSTKMVISVWVPSVNKLGIFVTALLIGLLLLASVLTGGMRFVLLSDKYQFWASLLAIIFVLYAVIDNFKTNTFSNLLMNKPSPAIVIFILFALSTQFYNIFNITYLADMNSVKDRETLLIRTILKLLPFYILYLAIAFICPNSGELFKKISGINIVFLSFLWIGFLSITLSTIDTTIIKTIPCILDIFNITHSITTYKKVGIIIWIFSLIGSGIWILIGEKYFLNFVSFIASNLLFIAPIIYILLYTASKQSSKLYQMRRVSFWTLSLSITVFVFFSFLSKVLNLFSINLKILAIVILLIESMWLTIIARKNF